MASTSVSPRCCRRHCRRQPPGSLRVAGARHEVVVVALGRRSGSGGPARGPGGGPAPQWRAASPGRPAARQRCCSMSTQRSWRLRRLLERQRHWLCGEGKSWASPWAADSKVWVSQQQSVGPSSANAPTEQHQHGRDPSHDDTSLLPSPLAHTGTFALCKRIGDLPGPGRRARVGGLPCNRTDAPAP